jgi:hypothetical protein
MTSQSRRGSYRLQLGNGNRIGMNQFGPARLDNAAAQAAFLDPGVQGWLWNTDLLGQLADRPFIRLTCDLWLAASIFGLDGTGPDQQVMDHRRVECIAPFGGGANLLD